MPAAIVRQAFFFSPNFLRVPLVLLTCFMISHYNELK